MKPLLSFFVVMFSFTPIFTQGIELEEPVKMLALGDSYTIGASVPTDERWPHQFVSELNARGISAETPDYIAVTGWTTQDLLRGIDRQLDTSKDYNLVSILIGVNNQYQGVSIDTYEPDLRKIIETALEVVSNDTGAVFMVSIPDYAYTPFGNGDEEITKGINAYNEINYRVATEYGLTYVNITTISRRGLGEPDLVASDGLHPSGEQYALWVEAILSWISSGPSTGFVSLERPADVMDQGMKLYPNPSTGTVRIISDPTPVSLRLLDMNGVFLSELIVARNEMHFDLSAYGTGVFFLEGIYPGFRKTVPIVLIAPD